MKILQVADVSASRVIGGAERFLSGQSTALANRGHRVVIMTRMPEDCEQARKTIGPVTEFRYRVNSDNPAAFFFSTLKNGKRLFDSLCRQYDFDVVNFHQPFSAYAVCRSPLCTGIKKIYTCHSLSFEEYVSRNPVPPGVIGRFFHALNVRGRRRVERYVLGRSDRIVVLSRYTANKLKVRHGIAPKKTVIIPGGVDLNRFYPARDKSALSRSLLVPENRVFLLTVRNLVPRMGLENLLKALALVRLSVPDVFLVIGGSGPLRRPLESLARDLGIADRVRFEGFIAEERLADYYRAADLFVLPTRKLEGFGLVTLEAMASGTPVAGTPVGGTLEILGAFDPGFLFEDTSAEAMAHLLTRLCSSIKQDPGRWAALGKRCRKFVEARYSWDANAVAMERLLQ